MENKYTIISLGGSMIVPDEIDSGFLRDFKSLILEKVKEGNKFVIITGGGKICRRYQDVAKDVASPSNDDLDWIGIASLRLNAELLRVVFGEYAHEKVISDLSEKLSTDKPVIIGAAYKPGQSTDWGAVVAAENFGAKKVINLSNVDYIYDTDPRINPNAKKFEKIKWEEYRSFIPKEWSAGLSTPFDPIASKLAEQAGLSVAVLNPKPIENLKKCLNGEDFNGTTIS